MAHTYLEIARDLGCTEAKAIKLIERLRGKCAFDADHVLWTGAMLNNTPVITLTQAGKTRIISVRRILAFMHGTLESVDHKKDKQVMTASCGNARCIRRDHLRVRSK